MTSDPTYPEPDGQSDPRVLVARQLAFQRATALARAGALPDVVRRGSALPSGWSPLELVSHLVHVEQRWIVWGFLGERVAEPWGDRDPADPDRWAVPASVSLDDLATRWAAVATRTASVLAAAAWEQLTAVTGRFATDPPTLGAIAVHLVQENARHLGHLDVVAELAGGPTGE